MPILRILSSIIPIQLLCRCRTYKKCTLLAALLLCVATLSTIQRALYAGVDHGNLQHPFEKLAEFTPVFKMLQAMKVPLVLLDPNVIRFNDTDPTLGAPNIVSFGVFENDSQKFQDFNQWRELRPRWWLTEAVGTDYRRLHPKEEHAIYTSVVTHYFFVSATSIVHVAVIFERNNFFWVAGIKDSLLASRYRFLTNLTYAIPLPMAVDKFECDLIPFMAYPPYNVCIPNDMEYYLWQIPQAKFFECHYDTIVYPFKRQYKMSEADTSPQKEALREVVAIAKELRIPLMIIFGTLLGWYRQCDYIVESLDMDTAMMDYEWKKEMFDRVFRSKTLTMYRRLGTLDLGLEFRTHTSSWVWLDIFLMYPRTYNQSYTYMLNQKYWMKSTYPIKKGVCSAELLGLLVYLPCNYEEYIRMEYGTDGWFAPVGGHPHRNMKMEDYFEDKEVVYLEHIYSNFTCANPNVMWGCDPEPPAVVNSTLYQNATRLAKRTE